MRNKHAPFTEDPNILPCLWDYGLVRGKTSPFRGYLLGGMPLPERSLTGQSKNCVWIYFSDEARRVSYAGAPHVTEICVLKFLPIRPISFYCKKCGMDQWGTGRFLPQAGIWISLLCRGMPSTREPLSTDHPSAQE